MFGTNKTNNVKLTLFWGVLLPCCDISCIPSVAKLISEALSFQDFTFYIVLANTTLWMSKHGRFFSLKTITYNICSDWLIT